MLSLKETKKRGEEIGEEALSKVCEEVVVLQQSSDWIGWLKWIWIEKCVGSVQRMNRAILGTQGEGSPDECGTCILRGTPFEVLIWCKDLVEDAP